MMNRIIISNVHRLLATAAVCLALGACSGEEGTPMPEAPQVPANPDALCTLTPHAVEICPVDVSATPLTRSATGEPEQKVTYAENLGHNFSAEATLEAEPQDAQTRAAGYLAAAAQYRIVVYDNSSGAIVGNVVYKKGSADVVSGDVIKLKAGTYRLFAYTFNSSSNIRGLDADNRNVTVNSGEDFMTYTLGFTISSADYGSGKQLNISFVRQCARLTVTIVVEGYTDNNVTAASLKVGNVFGSGSSKWNGFANTDASTLASVAGTASLYNITAYTSSVDCGPSTNKKYLITSPCSNQTISISDMVVDRSGLEFTYTTPFTFPNPVTLVKGGSYRLTIHTGDYYVLTPTNPVTINGMKWARSNLLQTGAGDSAPVSFVKNPWDYGSYWNWGMRDATALGYFIYIQGNANWVVATPGNANQDPCRSLGSGWYLPKQNQLIYLLNSFPVVGTKVRINGTINTTEGFGWAPDAKGVVFKDGNQVIFLPSSGWRDFTSYINAGDGGYYHSSDCVSTVEEKAYSLVFDGSTQPSVIQINRYIGASLRCVQTN